MIFRTRVGVGLDLGGSSLKVAVVNLDRKEIQSLWSAPLQPGRANRTDDLTDAALGERLKELGTRLHRDLPTLPKGVHINAQGEETYCSYAELPALGPKELPVAVASVASRLIPFPLEEVVLTHQSVRPVRADHKGQAVFLVAVRSEEVARLQRCSEILGLEARRIDAAPLALAREIGRNRSLPKDEFVAVVDCGFRLSHVVLVRDGLPCASRDFSLGGKDFTYAFQMGARCAWADAEAQKLAYDVARREPAIEPFLQRWLDEVKTSLDYFGAPVSRAVLTGGTAPWKGLAERLSGHLGLPVEVDGWEGFRLSRDIPAGLPAPAFKLAVGLALKD